MEYQAAFRCSEGCPSSYPLGSIIYRCPACDALLEVAHDMGALQTKSGQEWKELFQRRQRSSSRAPRSGVWDKKEWVAPHVAPANIVSLGEGGTHLLPSPQLAAQLGVEALFVKQCGNSHTGSFKDLGMTVLVSSVLQMVRDGQQIPAIACASTGDTSASLAAYAAAAGLRSVVILPKGMITAEQLVQPLSHGARVIAVETDFDGCMAIVQRLAQNDGVYLANSMNSLRLEGQKTVAIEILEQLGWAAPDWIVIPGGNLGNVSALGSGLDLLTALGLIDKTPRLAVAQAQRANPLYRSFKQGFQQLEPIQAGETVASAIRIGNPVSYARAVRALKKYQGVVGQATEAELVEATVRADRAGLYCCPHTGTALAVVEKLRASGTIASTDKVVVVSTANGLKFSEFKTLYHHGSLGEVPEPLNANPPIDVADDYEAVRTAVLRDW